MFFSYSNRSPNRELYILKYWVGCCQIVIFLSFRINLFRINFFIIHFLGGSKEETLITRKYFSIKLEHPDFFLESQKNLHITICDWADMNTTIHLPFVLDLLAGCMKTTDQTFMNSRDLEQLREIRLHIWDFWKPWSLFKLTALTELLVVKEKKAKSPLPLKTKQNKTKPQEPKPQSFEILIFYL